MSLLSAVCEPYMSPQGVEVHLAYDGEVDRIGHNRLFDKDMSKEEQEFLTILTTEYRWPLPNRIDTSEVLTLDEIHTHLIRYLRKYLWFSEENIYELLANWVIASYFRKEFHYMPLIIFDGITMSGKTTVLKVLHQVVYRGTLATGYSAAAIAREIEDWHTTILLDEAVDTLQSDRGGDMTALIKSTFEDSLWVRADPKGRQNFVYHTFTSVAMGVKGVGMPEDIYNRGVRISMVGMPENVRLADIDACSEDDVGFPDSPSTIRTALYCLQARTVAYPNDPKSASFKTEKQITRQHLTSWCNDRWMYAFVHGFPKESPEIRGRARNIASTLYTIAQTTNSEVATLQMIIDSNKMNREVILDTPESMAFISLHEIIMDEYKVVRNLNPVLTRGLFNQIVAKISTTAIAERYNLILFEQGNAETIAIPTKTVTTKISSLGLVFERGTHNLSWMVPTDKNFRHLYKKYVKIYCPGDAEIFENI